MKICPVCGNNYSNTSTLCPVDGEVLQNTADPLLGQTLAGKYEIEELIKTGGMGSVYRGRHILMDKRVAVKVLRPSLAVDDAVVARFSREAKAASRISHPHAVNVTDFGESENGVVFLVMEYLDGQTLKEIIKETGPMPLPRVVEILRQVAGALDAAHDQGVIHRDLKSDNIMLSQTNGGEWAKVLDFGIAKIQQPDGARDMDITAANLVIGTPQYMSPEQCSQSGPIDARSDLYSLGIIIYEMLAGRVPFTGESPTVIMMKQVQDEPPPLSEARPDLPVAVTQVVMRALAKQPADRYQSAGEFFKALSEASAVDALSVEAAPATVVAEPVTPLDDLDEETIVRPRQAVEEATVVQARRNPAPLVEPTPAPRLPPPPPEGVNPWRVILPAAVALVAVFGVVFFLTRGNGQTQSPNANVTQTGPGLVSDPSSQPVQPLGTPTGESERNIQSVPSSTPTPRVTNVNANVGEQIPPTAVIGNFGANSNNRNANQRESPTPKPTPREEDEPPPPPKPTPSKVGAKVTPTPEQP